MQPLSGETYSCMPDGSSIKIEVGEQSDVPSALRTYLSAFKFNGEHPDNIPAAIAALMDALRR